MSCHLPWALLVHFHFRAGTPLYYAFCRSPAGAQANAVAASAQANAVAAGAQANAVAAGAWANAVAAGTAATISWL